eukprot:4322237-Pyramimonas_sp.AAC.1
MSFCRKFRCWSLPTSPTFLQLSRTTMCKFFPAHLPDQIRRPGTFDVSSLVPPKGEKRGKMKWVARPTIVIEGVDRLGGVLLMNHSVV